MDWRRYCVLFENKKLWVRFLFAVKVFQYLLSHKLENFVFLLLNKIRIKFITKAGTSWTAKSSDFAQQLIIDLGSIRNISRIALQGRPHSTEYVTEFTISYGYNGLDYAEFKEPGGNVKVNKCQRHSNGLWINLILNQLQNQQ